MISKGIKTKYKGRAYRSRLEARWAAMFDMFGWKYEYEPFDLPGWIPDFIIVSKMPVLVEVKPAIKFEGSFPVEQIRSAMQFSEYSKAEVLLLGSILLGESSIGWLGENMGCYSEDEDSNDVDLDYGLAILTGKENETDDPTPPLGLIHEYQWFRDRISGHYPGGQRCGIEDSIIQRMWNTAGNTVQWNP